MTVPPHPRTGLRTVSRLFKGEVKHRDPSGAQLWGPARPRPTRASVLRTRRVSRPPIVMWRNLIARSRDEIVAFREQRQAEVIGGADAAARFGIVDGWAGSALPAPVMPDVRLRPRD